MRRRRLTAVAAALAGLAVLAAGCGVPTDGDTRSLGTAPFGLLTTTSTTEGATTVPPDEGFRLVLYWASPEDQIVAGDAIGLPTTPTFQQVIDLLVEGPAVQGDTGSTGTSPGSDQGLRTYITEGLNPSPQEGARAVGPLVTGVQDGTLDLLVNDRFRDESQATPTRFRLAIAQVVCTVTQFDNVDRVRFFDSRGQLTLVNQEQNPIEVATRDNIGRCDTGRRQSTTTTTTTGPPASSPDAPTRPTPPQGTEP